jgi:hypothetical protein
VGAEALLGLRVLLGHPVEVKGAVPGDQAGMEIPKDKILELLRQRGDHDKAQQADQQLPDQVDPERDKGMLDQLGIDPQDLLGNLGGLGDKLGL